MAAVDLAVALAWLAISLVVAAVAVPAAGLAFGGLPRRGAALAPAVALAVLGLVGFWVGQTTLAPALAVGVLALGATGWVGRRHDATPDPRALAAPAGVFVVAFGLLVTIRYVDPAIRPAGGEQFLDYGLIRSLLRADSLPPEDVWFAGRPVRYYYGGHLIGALLVRLTGTAPAYAYNLLQAVVFGALATAAFGVAEAVAGGERPAPRAGLLGAFFVALAGPLAPAARALLGAVPADVAARYGRAAVVGIRSSPAEALEYARAILAEPGYHYWTARYVVPDAPHVVPFWAFLNGDFRPHMVGAPLLVLVVAFCLAYFRAPAAARRRRRLLVFGAIPAVSGLLGAVNLWDLPAALGVVWLTVALADAHPLSLLGGPGDRSGTAGRVLGAGVVTALAGALAAAVAAPVLANPPVGDGVGFLPPRSPLVPLLLVYGGLLGAISLWLAARCRPLLEGHGRGRIAAGAAVCGIAVGWLATGGFGAVALAAPALVGAWLARRAGRLGFGAVLVAAGCGLLLVPEFAYARVWPHGAVRWNTVYKLGFQTWVVWGLVAAVAVAKVGAAKGRRTALVAVAAVVLLGAVFPAFSVASHFTDVTRTHATEEPGLDGTAHLDRTHPDESRAIDWLADREGTPTLLGRPGQEPYTWANAPASLTGLPTVVGWRHEAGYRGLERYRERVEDVRRIYTGDPGTARRRIAEYGVDYVYVGPRERAAYGTPAVTALEGVTVAYHRANATVYAVNASGG